MGVKYSALLNEVEIGKPVDEKQSVEIFEKYDATKNGYLEKGEVENFVYDWCVAHNVKDVEKAKRAFWATYDPGNTRRITKAALFAPPPPPPAKKEDEPKGKGEKKEGETKTEKTSQASSSYGALSGNFGSSHPSASAETIAAQHEKYKIVPQKEKHKDTVDKVKHELLQQDLSAASAKDLEEFTMWFLDPRNLVDLAKHRPHYLARRWMEDKGGVVLWRAKPTPDGLTVVISDPNEARRALSTPNKRGTFQVLSDALFGVHVLDIGDEKAAAAARAVYPLILAGDEWLHNLEPVIAHETAKWLKTMKHAGSFDLFTASWDFLFPVLSICAFGVPLPQGSEHLRIWGEAFQQCTSLDKTPDTVKVSPELAEEHAKYSHLLRTTLHARVKKGGAQSTVDKIAFTDLIGRLLELGHNPLGGGMQNELLHFFHGGFGTFSIIQTLLYYAAWNEDIWNWAKEKPKERSICFVKEVIRVQNGIPLIARHLHKGYQVGGHTLENDTPALICPWAMNYRKDSFGDDADKFRPARWAEGKLDHPPAYLPFGAGNRVCPGGAFTYTLFYTICQTLLTSNVRFSFVGSSGQEEGTYKTYFFAGALRTTTDHRIAVHTVPKAKSKASSGALAGYFGAGSSCPFASAETIAAQNEKYKIVPQKEKHKDTVDKVKRELLQQDLSAASPKDLEEFTMWFLDPRNLLDLAKHRPHYLVRRWMEDKGGVVLWRAKPTSDGLTVVITDPNEARKVLSTHNKRGIFQVLGDTLFGVNLTQMCDEKAAATARAVYPLILAGDTWVKNLEPVIAHETAKWLKTMKHAGSFDLFTASWEFLFPVLSLCAFGVPLPEGSERLRLWSEAFQQCVSLDKTPDTVKVSPELAEEHAKYSSLLRTTLHARVKKGGTQSTVDKIAFTDLIGRLLELGHNPLGGGMQNELILFFLGGFGTFSILQTLLYYAAWNEDIWNWAKEKPKERSMYFVKEVIRVQSGIPLLARHLPKGYQVGGHTLENDTPALVCPFAMNYRKDSFGEDADKFRPARWADGKLEHPPAYLPFGAGSRGCPGSAFTYTLFYTICQTLLTSDVRFSFLGSSGQEEGTYKTYFWAGGLRTSSDHRIAVHHTVPQAKSQAETQLEKKESETSSSPYGALAGYFGAGSSCPFASAETIAAQNEKYKIVPQKEKHKDTVDKVKRELLQQDLSAASEKDLEEFTLWFLDPRNLVDLAKHRPQYLARRWMEDKGGVVLWRAKPTPDGLTVIVTDPNEARKVLGTHNKRGIFQVLADALFGVHVLDICDEKAAAAARAVYPLTLAGDEWVKNLEPVIAHETAKWLKTMKQTGSFDLFTGSYDFLFPLMSTCVFGVPLPEGSERLRVWSEEFHKCTSLDKTPDTVTVSPELAEEHAKYSSLLRTTLHARVKKGGAQSTVDDIVFTDLVGKLLELGRNPLGGGMQNELLHFFHGGFGTFSIIQTLLYYAAWNEDIWNWAKEKPKERSICFVKEVIRVQSGIPLNARHLHKGAQVGGHTLENDAPALVCPWAMNYRADSFGDDAKKFRPARWEDGKLDNPPAYLPFGAGSRDCPGAAFTYTLFYTIAQTLLTSDVRFSFFGSGQEEGKYKTFFWAGGLRTATDHTIFVQNAADRTTEVELDHFRQLLEGGHVAVETAQDMFVELGALVEKKGPQVAEQILRGKDPRIDFWTKETIGVIVERQDNWHKPGSYAIGLPRFKQPLKKSPLFGTPVMVPIEDEDWPVPSLTQMEVARILREYTPNFDEFVKNQWDPSEDPEYYVRKVLGNIWPRTNVYWNDRTSDDALERFVFFGLGQVHVQKLKNPKWPDVYYGLELESMSRFEVRPGFEKYGASAYFSKQGKIVRIVREGKEYLPSETQEWEWVKMAFRGSTLLYVTVHDHLLALHATVSNFLTTFSREELSPHHPLRRLIKPFTFRSVFINYAAGASLFSVGGFLHRATSLTMEGLKDLFASGWDTFQFETFPMRCARHAVELNTPFQEDGLELYAIYERFVRDYMNVYFPDDASVLRDKEIVAFWKALNDIRPPKATIPPLGRAGLDAYLAWSFFVVSAGHNAVGTIAEYVADPGFCPSVLIAGKLRPPPIYAIRTGLLACATGFPQPALLDDISHVLLDDKGKQVYRVFLAALNDQAKVVDKRNRSRLQPYQGFNPRFCELAVSI